MTSRGVAFARVLLGLGQGVVLYGLFEATNAGIAPWDRPRVAAPVYACLLLVPLAISLSLGHLRPAALALWSTLATLALAGLVLNQVTDAPDAGQTTIRWAETGLGGQAIVMLLAGLFIAQALALAMAADRRWLPHYGPLVEAAWTLAIQLGLALAFVGLFWSVLWLGAGMFAAIGLDGVRRLIGGAPFAITATTLAAAAAIDITDSRTRLILGARAVVHALLAALLPLITFITVAFLLSLPFVSLAPLWATHNAATLLSGAAAMQILLINAAYEDGQVPPGRLLRLAGRLGALLLLPVVALAAVALGLRVTQYGWSPDRVLAAAFLLVAAVYATGYAAASIRSARWMSRIEGVNVLCAGVTLVMIVALLSPLADPSRIATASQLARLRSGAVTPEAFDFTALRFRTGRHGRAALAELAADPTSGPLQARAQAALAARTPYDVSSRDRSFGGDDLVANVTVHPTGRVLPPGMRVLAKSDDARRWSWPGCLRERDTPCDAVFVTLRDDSSEQLAFLTPGPDGAVFVEGPNGGWTLGATFTLPAQCGAERALLLSGAPPTAAAPWRDFLFGSGRVVLHATENDPSCGPLAR